MKQFKALNNPLAVNQTNHYIVWSDGEVAEVNNKLCYRAMPKRYRDVEPFCILVESLEKAQEALDVLETVYSLRIQAEDL